MMDVLVNYLDHLQMPYIIEPCSFRTRRQTKMLIVYFHMQEFHESLHSLLLWLDHAERRCQAASISEPDTSLSALQEHRNTLRVGTRSLLATAHILA